MAFTSSIKGRILTPPADKRMPEGGKLEWKWGEWDGAAVTTGDIDLECDSVLYFSPTISTASPTTPPQVELDTDGSGAMAGWVNLTFTSGKGGRWLALCKYN